MMRTEAPKDLVGRGEENLARTTPELPVIKIKSAKCHIGRKRVLCPNVPCGRVTLPQITRILVPRISL